MDDYSKVLKIFYVFEALALVDVCMTGVLDIERNLILHVVEVICMLLLKADIVILVFVFNGNFEGPA